jgi:hypothetical protein
MSPVVGAVVTAPSGEAGWPPVDSFFDTANALLNHYYFV